MYELKSLIVAQPAPARKARREEGNTDLRRAFSLLQDFLSKGSLGVFQSLPHLTTLASGGSFTRQEQEPPRRDPHFLESLPAVEEQGPQDRLRNYARQFAEKLGQRPNENKMYLDPVLARTHKAAVHFPGHPRRALQLPCMLPP